MFRKVPAFKYIEFIRFDGETVLPLVLAAFLVSADARVIAPTSKSFTPRLFPKKRLALTANGALSVSKSACLQNH